MAGGIDWFRWHHGSVTDPKFQLIARKSGASLPDVLAVWAYLLESASASGDRGSFGEIDAEALDCLFNFPDTETRTADIIAAMRDRGLLDGDRIEAWDRRQPKRERESDDTATERKRQQRAREAEESTVTPSHATSHPETPREEKRREEEKKEEKSKAKAPAQPSVALPDWIPAGPWAGYLEMRKKKRKEPTARAIELLVAELEKLKLAGHDIGAVLDKSTVNGWTDVYALKNDQQPRGSPGAPSQLGKAGQATAANAQRLLEKMRRENGSTG